MNAQVHIDTLRFKGNESQRQRFVNRLEQAAWGGLDDREYVFIRSLSASGQTERLAEQIVSATVDARLQAVNGWRAGNGDEPAVYFASLAELLACLVVALIHNRPAWYWKQWRSLFEQSYSQALTGIWQQYRREIPAMTAHLAKHDELHAFWESISEPTAKALLTVLLPGDAEFSGETQAHPDVRDTNIPNAWLNRWRSACHGVTDNSSRFRLAALLVLQEWQPLALQPPYDITGFHAVVRALQSAALRVNSVDRVNDRFDKTSESSTSDPLGFSSLSGSESKMSGDESAQAPKQESTEENRFTGEPSTGTSQQPIDIARSASRSVLAAPHLDLEPINTSQSGNQEDDLPAKTPLQTHSPAIGQVSTGSLQPADEGLERRFQIEQGGLFYLLNFLNLSTVQAQLLTGIAHPLTISGWGWLYRLGQTLGLEQEAPLQQLLVFLCGFDDIDSLEQLPPLENVDRLLTLGRQRYSERLFNAALLVIPAEVQVDGTHVDVFYALNDVRLEVRQAGLDLDPGWLSWLGKVVAFHYRSFA